MSLELYKVEFTADEIRNLPSVHRSFFMGTCLAINEISMFQKMLIMGHNSLQNANSSKHTPFREMALAQILTIERNLAAKLIEYLNLLDDFRKKCNRMKIADMSEFLSRIDLVSNQIRSGAEYQLAKWFRNSVTSHYLMSEFESLIENSDLGTDEALHPIYLHTRDANSSYLLGEQLLIAKFLEDGENAVDRRERFRAWVLETSSQLMEFHHMFCIQLLEKHLPAKKFETLRLDSEHRLVGELRETCLPILWALDDDGA